MSAFQQQLAVDESAVKRLAEIILSLHRGLLLHLCESLAEGQVSFSQFFMLSHVSDDGPLSMTEIAGRMRHTTAAATGLVDRLEKLAFVTRVQASEDRRKVLVKILPKGQELVSYIRADISGSLVKVMQHLTPDEQIAWIGIYEKIIAYVDSQPTTTPVKCSSNH